MGKDSRESDEAVRATLLWGLEDLFWDNGGYTLTAGGRRHD